MVLEINIQTQTTTKSGFLGKVDWIRLYTSMKV